MGLRRELERYLVYYNYDRAHNGRLTQGRTPAEVSVPLRCIAESSGMCRYISSRTVLDAAGECESLQQLVDERLAHS